jgi:P-type E1-E2 ATPase
VTEVESFSTFSQDELLSLAVTLEQRSEHPLALAVCRYAQTKGVKPQELTEFKVIPGRGVSVITSGKHLFGGSKQLLEQNGLSFPADLLDSSQRHQREGRAVIFVGIEKQAIGFIALADTIRSDAKGTVQQIEAQGVKTVLLTGDHREAAKNIASEAGISNVHYELLPEDKVNIIEGELNKDGNDKVLMVGDGLNDAPALKTAYVGLAMGGAGSGMAVDAADGVLVRDDLKRLPHLLRLAKKTASTIKINIGLSMFLNLITVILAATGLMGPVLGALAHNAGAFLIVFNSARLLNTKDTTSQGYQPRINCNSLKKL